MDDKWIKYFQDELTVLEKQELFSHVESDDEFKQDFSQINNAWAISLLQSQKDDYQIASKGKRRLDRRIRKSKGRAYIIKTLRYAAIFCIACLSTWYLTTKDSTENGIVYTEINVPSGQRLHITLADGSSVWLSPRTKLTLPNEFHKNNRIIEIDGEGFFEIVKDEKRPFVVKSKGYNIEVLGTKFNLFSYSKNHKYEAHLLEGKVQVYSEANRDSAITLFPYEKVSLIDGKLSKSILSFDNEEFIKSGIYNFQSTPFIDILEYLSLWYDVQFDVKGPVALTTKVNAKFRLNDDIENILTALQNAFKFKYKRINDNKIEISK